MSHADRRLGDALRNHRLVSTDQLRVALAEQKAAGGLLGELLVRLGFLAEQELLPVLAEHLGYAPVNVHDYQPGADVLGCIDRADAARLRVLPLAHDPQDACLLLAMANPTDLAALDLVRAGLPRHWSIEVRLAGENELLQAIDKAWESVTDPSFDELEPTLGLPGHGVDEPEPAQVVALVDGLLHEAVRCGASDLHFEPGPGFVQLRWRVDGVLRLARCLHVRWWTPVLLRLKVLCGMNIAESRQPQDGRLVMSCAGRSIDFRAAIHPGLHGENLVLRVLDRSRPVMGLHELGLADTLVRTLRRLLSQRDGLLLVTGPTGSGKTTTLYAMLAELDRQALNIMTLEDPVEYVLPRLRQTSMGEGNRLDFATGVRSLLRQDPDKLLIGEIRDAETAGMAVRASLTGHQVFSTLHCHCALAAIPRLQDMGVQARTLAASLRAVLGQRLLRRLCPACRAPDPSFYHAHSDAGHLAGVHFQPVGCARCGQQGYRGRVAVMEIIEIDARLGELTGSGAGMHELRACLMEQGARSLNQQALELVHAGVTSLAEVERVFGLQTRGAP